MLWPLGFGDLFAIAMLRENNPTNGDWKSRLECEEISRIGHSLLDIWQLQNQ
jgi:hypothetical protein